MNKEECELCIKYKTLYCPNSSECYMTQDKPYYQNRIMLLEENQQLQNDLDSANSKVSELANKLLQVETIIKYDLKYYEKMW